MDVLVQGKYVAEDPRSGLGALSHAHRRLDVPVLERPAVPAVDGHARSLSTRVTFPEATGYTECRQAR